MNSLSSYKFWSKVLLVAIHAVGIIGMLSPLRAYFLILTPFNLIISFILLLSFHTERSPKFYLIAIFIMLAGFLIELIGVNTGWPFGSYTYGEPLGPQWMGTPFMIGVNWFIMSYCGAMLFKDVTRSPLINAILAGTAITLLDCIIEPVAIHLTFWNWSSAEVPIQNYITWGVCISIFSMLLYKLDLKNRNPISNWVLGVQILFFAGILIGTNL